MPRVAPILAIAVLVSCLTASAQRVSPYDSHYRIYAIVDRDGKVTNDDPYRPKHIANPKKKDASDLKILAWTAVLSPDKKRYYVEIVADKKADLDPLLNDPSVQWWDKAVTPPNSIQRELAKFSAAAQIGRLKVRAR